MSKKTKSKLQIQKKIAKSSNYRILQLSLHMTHLLKLLDNMFKYEIDPTSIVEETVQTQFCPQTDGQTERWTDKRTDMKPVYSPFNFIEAVV